MSLKIIENTRSEAHLSNYSIPVEIRQQLMNQLLKTVEVLVPFEAMSLIISRNETNLKFLRQIKDIHSITLVAASNNPSACEVSS